ncbi:MAG: hypothetical protein K2O42_10490, partial [Oscillospiraceae bacterium]|nr:hypothetical protein [Oscillospiraceae bacterium]
MKTMKQVETLNKEGKTYQILYKGRPVADITLEHGDTLTRANAYEVVEEILCKQRPGMMINYALVS